MQPVIPLRLVDRATAQQLRAGHISIRALYRRDGAAISVFAITLDRHACAHHPREPGGGSIRVARCAVSPGAAMAWRLWRIDSDKADALPAASQGIAIHDDTARYHRVIMGCGRGAPSLLVEG